MPRLPIRGEQIDSSEVWAILGGKSPKRFYPVNPDGCVVSCQGRMVAILGQAERIDHSDQAVPVVTHIACPHPDHGVHHRFQEMQDRIKAIMAELGTSANPQATAHDCQDGWIEFGSPMANLVCQMAKSFGHFRGIPLTSHEEIDNNGDIHDLQSRASGSRPDGSPTPPAGIFLDQPNPDEDGGQP